MFHMSNTLSSLHYNKEVGFRSKLLLLSMKERTKMGEEISSDLVLNAQIWLLVFGGVRFEQKLSAVLMGFQLIRFGLAAKWGNEVGFELLNLPDGVEFCFGSFGLKVFKKRNGFRGHTSTLA